MFSFFKRKKKESEITPSLDEKNDIPKDQEGKLDVELKEDHAAEQEHTIVQSVSPSLLEKENEVTWPQHIDDENEVKSNENVLDTPAKINNTEEPLAPTSFQEAAIQEKHPLFETQQDKQISESSTDTSSRLGWMKRLSSGLKKTGKGITEVFTGTKIDDELYEELEAALLMADTGTAATQYLLDDVKKRVKETKAKEPAAVRTLLAQALEQLLTPLEVPLNIGIHTPTVIMVAGVNGAGKTTSIGKLTRYLANTEHKVLLAAGDTFRAAAREQLEVWADRNQVEIIAQSGGDPASVSFDAVSSGKAKQTDVVLIDTAGRLATQPHLMEELKKIRRVIGKAMPDAPHEVLLVVDGNTGQNALAQVKAFDDAIGLTGLIVTKLDGTAKGGVMAAIALWSQERNKAGKPIVPIYFIGIGEQVEDLQNFKAKEFANALMST